MWGYLTAGSLERFLHLSKCWDGSSLCHSPVPAPCALWQDWCQAAVVDGNSKEWSTIINSLSSPPVAVVCSCKKIKSLFRFQLFIIYETSEKQHLMKSPAPSGEELDKHCCHSTHDLTDLQCALWINSSKSSGHPGTAWFSKVGVLHSPWCFTAPVPEEAQILSWLRSTGAFYLLCCLSLSRTEVHEHNSRMQSEAVHFSEGAHTSMFLKIVEICSSSAGPQLNVFRSLLSQVLVSL